MEELCGRLRMLVQDCLAKHLYDSAIFYADKLTTMSGRVPRDAYLLAQVTPLTKMPPLSTLCCNEQDPKAIHLFMKSAGSSMHLSWPCRSACNALELKIARTCMSCRDNQRQAFKIRMS
jgi:hypothetical protein